MSMNLTCTQVSALLSFYLDDRLNDQLKQFVKIHLDVCPTCRAKFDALKDMIDGLKEIHEHLAVIEPVKKNVEVNPQIEEFKMNLSAYIDNELSDEENIKVKKYIISNSKARDEFENLYKLKKMLHTSFEKSKNDVREDYSKYILRRIDIQEEIYGNDSFAKVVALFLVLFVVCIVGAVIIFWV